MFDLTDQTEENKEKDLYQQTFPLICNKLGIEGVVTVARWSYTSNKLKLFSPIYVGNLTNGQINKLNAAFDDSFDEALKKFSFTQLIADNKREVGFHFKNGKNQVNSGDSNGIDLVEISLDKIDTQIIDKLCEEFVKSKIGLRRYGNLRFSEFAKRHKDAINNTLNKAILSLFSSGITNIYFIPLSIPSSTKEVAGIVAVNLMQEHDFSELVHILRPFVQGIMAPFHIQELDKLRISHALRSAIATIMGRVNAHDMGHVLANAKLPSNNTSKKNNGYFRHLTRFLRERMVFAAEAAATDPSWTMSLPVVSQIIFPFAYFMVNNQTYSAPVCRHIAQSEGVDQVNVTSYCNKKLLEYSNGEEGLWRCKPHDVYVNVPTGLVGVHGLYCIFENVIRNGAKYGKNKANHLNLNVYLDTKGFEQEHEFIRVRVWDDHSTYNAEQFEYICQFFPQRCHPKWIKAQAEDRWRIIGNSGELVSGGFGIKEMRIAAAWLRKACLNDAFMGKEDLSPSLLRPIIVTNSGEFINEQPETLNSDVYMGYEFYMLKPKEVLIVDSELKEIENQAKNNLQMKGIDLFTDDLTKAFQRRFHHYACIIKAQDLEQYRDWMDVINKRRDQLPSVLMLVSNDMSIESDERPLASVELDMTSYQSLKEKLIKGQNSILILEAYQRWIKKNLEPPEKLTLVLHLKPSENISAPKNVMELWKITAQDFNQEFANWTMVAYSDEAPERYIHTEDSELIVYDYHEIWKKNDANKVSKSIFYESCHSNQPTQIVLFNPPDDRWVRFRIALGLVEAAITKVAIVDERIFKAVKRYGDDFLKERRDKQKVFIPEEDIIQYEKPSQEDTQRLLKWLRDYKIKMLVIHQGIFDKIFTTKESVDDIERRIAEIKQYVPFVIIESDRSEKLLHRLPYNVRFVPFSAIEPWISDGIVNKYPLVQTLLSSNRGGKRT